MSGAPSGDDRGHPDAAATHNRAPTACGRPSHFVEGSEAVDFQPRNREEAYGFVRDTLERFGCRCLGRRQGRGPRVPRRHHTPADVRLLADVDEACGQMSGPAAREVLRRQSEVFGDARFERLAAPSNGHLYNLRGSPTYRASAPCGRGVRVRRRRRRHLGALPAAAPLGACCCPSRSASSASTPTTRRAETRRLRVHQPPRRGAARQAPRRAFHQVLPAHLQRQRPGRCPPSRGLRERPRRAPPVRPRPHRAALRRRRQPLRAGHPVAVPQLPPPLPVRHPTSAHPP